MATGNTLIDDAARTSRLPRPTIKAYVHKLRGAGLIGPTAPGGAALPVDEFDAAALLAATLAEPMIAEVAETTENLLLLRQHSAIFIGGSAGKLFWANRLPSISPDDLTHMATFGEALRYLICRAEEFCSQGETQQTGLTTLFNPKVKQSKIKIAYYRPAETAFITVKISPTDRLQIKFSDELYRPSDDEADDDPEFNAYDESDHQAMVSKVIGGPQILAYALSVLKPINPP